MLFRGCVVAALVLIAGPATAGTGPWTLAGRVFDADGHPAADVDLSVIWNANGVSLEELHRIERGKGDPQRLNINEGHMEPWGDHPARTDAQGRFSVPLSWTNGFLLALDRERKHGALIVVDPPVSKSDVKVTLGPLVRLHGAVRLATGQHPDWVNVLVRLPHSDRLPLRLDRVAVCSSLEQRFEFPLPAGRYELESGAEVSGQEYELKSLRAVTLRAGSRDADAGTLELTPTRPGRFDRIQEARAKGTWRDVDRAKLYGRPAPRWNAVDTRGIPKDAQVADFKGKWVFVYFWAPWCRPCLGRHLPALVEFYEAHKKDRDRFEMITVCNSEPDIKTMADLDRQLQPVVKAVWRKPLPLPIVLDNTLVTMENFGVAGDKFLFDPAGRLVPGDENTLADKLKRTPLDGSKQTVPRQ
jgi:thiol-disulfide isomerase/thioredoxin